MRLPRRLRKGKRGRHGLAPGSDTQGHQPSRLLLSKFGDGAVDRGYIPEILYLKARGIAFDLAGQREEREIVGSRICSTAV